MKNSESKHLNNPLPQTNDWKRTGVPPDGFTIAPPDANFSWIILIACCLAALTALTTSIVFVVSINDLIYALDTNMATLSWALAIASGGGNFIGPLVAMVVNTYSCRLSVIIGGIICSTGLVVTSYVNKVEILLVSFGVFTGIGKRFIFAPLHVLLGQYFKKYLGIAMGLLTASFAASRLIMTPLLQLVLEKYGYRGTFLITGGLMLHVCLCASLFHPPKWHYQLIPNSDEGKSDVSKSTNGSMDSKKIIHDIINQPNNVNESEMKPFMDGNLKNNEFKKDWEELATQEDEHSKTDFLKYTENKNRLRRKDARRLSELSINLESSLDIFEPICTESENESDASTSEKKSKGCCSALWNNRFCQSLDYSLLKERLFYLICTENAFLTISTVYTTIFTFHYAIEAGLLPMQAAGLISARSFGEIAGRLAGPMILTFINVSARTSYLAYMFLHGISLIVLTKMNSIAALYGVGGVAGLLFGAAVGVHGLLIIQKMGLKRLTSVLGLCSFFQSFYVLIVGPILGWIRDSTGAYSPCLLVLGFVQFCVALIWILEPLLVKKRNTNEGTTL